MAKGSGSEKSLQKRTAQIASKGTAREAYLKGDESNPNRALAKAKALVLAEVKKQRGGG